MGNFALSYLILTFGGCLGVYQMAAAAGGFKGLRFLQNRRFGFLIGVIIFASTFIWFFTRTDLNMPHREVEGAQQLSLFLTGAFLALVCTFVISSLVNLRGISPKQELQIDNGLDDLKSRTVFNAFAYRLKRWRAGK